MNKTINLLIKTIEGVLIILGFLMAYYAVIFAIGLGSIWGTPTTEAIIGGIVKLGSFLFGMLFISIISGLFFARNFIIWNFISIFFSILASSAAKLGEGYFAITTTSFYFPVIFAALFSFYSFLVSDFFKDFSVVKNWQTISNRLSSITKIIPSFLIYAVFLFSMLAADRVSYISPMPIPMPILNLIIFGVIIPVLVFYLLYRKAEKLPPKDLIFRSKDYWYPILLILILILSAGLISQL